MTNRLGPKFNIHYIVSANVNGAFLLKKLRSIFNTELELIPHNLIRRRILLYGGVTRDIMVIHQTRFTC